MKTLLSALLLTLTFQIAKSQTNTVTGSVQDENGRLLHYVLIEDSKYKNAVFTDSVGNFSIPLHEGSSLKFQLAGYRDTLVSVDKTNQSLQIVLRSFVHLPVDATHLALRTVRTENGLVAVARTRPNLVGSRYLFDTFSHGFFKDTLGRLINSPFYLFNYEKMGGTLLLTADQKNVMAVDRTEIKSFTLYNNADQRVEFENVPAIDNSHYVQVLAKGNKFNIYKLIKTKFNPSDFENTASGGAGHDYDEYVDDAEYFVFDVQKKQVQKIALRKKSIKDSFTNAGEKVDKFFSGNASKIDDSYLSSLGDFMNQ